ELGRNGGEPLSDGTVHFLRLLGAGHFAGTDCPDRLVGDDAEPRALRELTAHGVELTEDDFERFSGFAFGERLTDARDRPKAGFHRRRDFVANEVVALGEVLATLAVPENDPCRSGGDEHRRADFARERAALLGVEVLSRNLDV